MKQFFKFVFASFFGMMLFSIVTGLFALFTIAGMIASQDTTKEPEDNSVLVLNLSGQWQNEVKIISLVSCKVLK